jgi:beta-lactamase class A
MFDRPSVQRSLSLLALVLFVLLILAAISLKLLFQEDKASGLKHEQSLNIYLAPRLLEEIKDFNGKIGIALYDLETRESLLINAQEAFPAASLIKIPIMLEYFRQIQEKRLSDDQLVTYNAVDRAGGNGHVQTYPLGTRFRLGDLLVWMITQSDNDATRILMRIVGPERLNYDLRLWGLKTTQLNSYLPSTYPEEKRQNRTTPAEMLRSFQLIFDNKLFTPDNSQKMLRILEQQVLNEEMPRYLPKALAIGHKTGLLAGVVHDAGIVTLFKKRYILCVLSQGDMPLLEQSNYLGRISRMIYNYFSYNRGSFLMGASSAGKRRQGVLLLAGQSYPADSMKDLAEFLYADGFAVYCLPFPENKAKSVKEEFNNDLSRTEQALALLRNYSQKQYVICSSLESFYFLSGQATSNYKALILLPDRRDRKLLTTERYARVLVPLRHKLGLRAKLSFREYVYFISMCKEHAVQQNIKFPVPVAVSCSGPFYIWLKDLLPDRTTFMPDLPVNFTHWTNIEFQKIRIYLRSVN